MNLVLHIVRKDILRLRWWLVAWAVVLALPILIGLNFARYGEPSLGGVRVEDLIAGWQLLEAAVAWLLTLVLVQEDAAMGSRQFWITRPISGTRLVAAKVGALVVILGLLPVVVAFPWWLWAGLDARGMAVAALESCVLGLLVGAPAMLVATFTDSIARALLWTLAVLASILFTGFFLVVVTTAAARDGGALALALSRDIVAAIAVTMLCGVFAISAYRWRRLFPTMGAFGGAVLVAVVFATRSHWRLFPSEPELLHPERASGVQLRLAHAWTEPVRPQRRAASPDLTHGIESLFAVDSAPRGKLMLGLAVRQSWRWPDGTGLERARLATTYQDPSWAFKETLGLRVPGPDPETAAWWQQERERLRREWEEARRTGTSLRRGARLPPPSAGAKLDTAPLVPAAIGEGAAYTIGVWDGVAPSLAKKMITTPASYTARVWFAIMQPRLAFEMPLVAGATKRDVGGRIRIAGVDRHNDVDDVTLVGTQTWSWWEQVRAHVAARGWWDWGYTLADRAGPVVVNRERGELNPCRRRDSRFLAIAGVQIRWDRFVGSGGEVYRDGKLVAWPGWLEGATFAILWLQPEAVIARDVTVPALRLEEFSRASTW